MCPVNIPFSTFWTLLYSNKGENLGPHILTSFWSMWHEMITFFLATESPVVVVVVVVYYSV